MNMMNRLAWRSLWKNRTRTLVTIVGIILSAAMFAAVATLGVSLRQYLVDITIYNTGDYFIRFDNVTAEEVEAIQAREEISQLGIARTLGYVNVGTVEKNQSFILTALDENAFEMRTILLKKSNREYGQTLIVITHDESIALQADRILAIEDGHIVRDEVIR